MFAYLALDEKQRNKSTVRDGHYKGGTEKNRQ